MNRGTGTPRWTAALPARTAALVRNLPRRVGEPGFWITQAGVLGITVIHVAVELWLVGADLNVPSALHHIPAVLYLVPIGYASLRYGSEGAILTGLWSALLTVPNLLLWHRADFEWLSELLYIGIVVVIGVVMAIPVEQERRQRQRAEATNRRLALLDEIATLTLTADLQETLDTSLRHLLTLLHVDGACVALAGQDHDQRSHALEVIACQGMDGVTAEDLLAGVGSPGAAGGLGDPVELDGGIIAMPLAAHLPGSGSAGRVEGALAVRTGDRELLDDDHRLLAGVASHLAIAMASAQLQASERDRLRSYAQLVTQAQEQERKRIARELHDEGAQNLVAVRRELDRLAEATSDHPVARDLRRLHRLTGETLGGLRRFSRDLRPPTLDKLGLTSALDALVAEFEHRTEASCELHVEGRQHRLGPETELALFRIGQAALHNIEQHAAATWVTVEVTFDRRGTWLAVTDDGDGFEPPERPDELTRLGKLGLAGMHERAHLVGGRLGIDSAPGHGTRIHVEVPRAGDTPVEET